MSSRLDRVTNWPEIAEQSRFRVAILAQRLNVTARHLDRYCLLHFKSSTKVVLRQFQMSLALRLMMSGVVTIKEVAYGVGFHTSSHFCRAFKRTFGCSPTQYLLTQMIQNGGAVTHGA